MSWSVGCITPIYKGKGNKKDPDNYRGITVLSCFGKLFTSVLNERINSFLEDNKLLGNEQAGFRKNHSTTEHMFSLHCIISLYLHKRKRLYCTFVDYRKAFDSIQRSLLWEKLFQSGVNGNILDIIKGLYNNAKSCVRTSSGLSSFFVSTVGLRQGENLSPILFSLYLNDLKDFLSGRTDRVGLSLPFSMATEYNAHDIDDYFRLFLLLYADDTVILAESAEDMQHLLLQLQTYCETWGLRLNVGKTKIVIFSRGKVRQIPNFYYNHTPIDTVWHYKYLGVTFNYNNKFGLAIKERCKLATSAMFSLLKKIRKNNLPLDVQIELFERCVHPVLLYGCELWGLENIMCSRLQLRFLKMVLGVKASTPSCMVYGELGCLPIDIEVKARMLCFWYDLVMKTVNGFGNTSVLLFKLCNYMFDSNQYKLPWLQQISTFLNELGLTFLWRNPVFSPIKFKTVVKQRLKDQYLQTWRSIVYDSGTCYNYRLFKENLCFEKYLLTLPQSLRLSMIKFRTCNNRFPVQQERFLNIPRNERKCTICEKNEIGDEFHYLFVCSSPAIKNKRSDLLPRYFQHHPSVLKFSSLMNTCKRSKFVKLAKFVHFLVRMF